MQALKAKKSLVTAGGQGIGKAIVEELARWGADVAIHFFSNRASAENLAQQIQSNGGRAFAFGADLTREKDVCALLDAVRERFGGLDILINNAGSLIGRQSLEGMSLEFHRKVFAVNLDSMMLVTREALPLLKNCPLGASIVNLASLAGRKGGHPGSLAYSAAKGAVLTWTRALATELALFGIRVNAVAPGLILGTSFHDTHTTEESKRQTVATIPLGRSGTPQDVARAVAFLASETNGFITGATLDINGGAYMA